MWAASKDQFYVDEPVVKDPGQDEDDVGPDCVPAAPVSLGGASVDFLERLLQLLAGSDADVTFAVTSSGFGSRSLLSDAVHAELQRQCQCC